MDAALELWFRSDSDHDDDGAWEGPRRNRGGPEDGRASLLAVPHADASLCAQLRAGDDSAFRELYVRYYAALTEYATGLLSDSSAAHDVVQELFLTIWRGRTEWEPGHIAAYLYRATRDRALNHLGAIKRRARLLGSDAPTNVAGVSETPLAPDEDLHLQRFREALDRAIAALTESRREIAMLRWRHGKSLAEIAAITGSSVKAVSMSLARIRSALQPIVDSYLRDG